MNSSTCFFLMIIFSFQLFAIDFGELTELQFHEILKSNLEILESDSNFDSQQLAQRNSEISKCKGLYDIKKSFCHKFNSIEKDKSTALDHDEKYETFLDNLKNSYDKPTTHLPGNMAIIPSSELKIDPKKYIRIGGEEELRKFLEGGTFVVVEKDKPSTGNPFDPEVIIRDNLKTRLALLNYAISNQGDQLFYKGLPISYEQILTKLIEIYIENMINAHDVNKLINGFLEKCLPEFTDEESKKKLMEILKKDIEDITKKPEVM